MSDRNGTLAEVLSLDKYRRSAYNLTVVTALSRLALTYFTPHEFVTYMVLLSHTLLIGRDSVTAPHRFFTEGVRTDNGCRAIQNPLPFNRRTLMRALAGLEEKGWITVTRNMRQVGHGATKGANTYSIELAAIKDMLETQGYDPSDTLVYDNESKPRL